jgi:hypothetical protein
MHRTYPVVWAPCELDQFLACYYGARGEGYDAVSIYIQLGSLVGLHVDEIRQSGLRRHVESAILRVKNHR